MDTVNSTFEKAYYQKFLAFEKDFFAINKLETTWTRSPEEGLIYLDFSRKTTQLGLMIEDTLTEITIPMISGISIYTATYRSLGSYHFVDEAFE